MNYLVKYKLNQELCYSIISSKEVNSINHLGIDWLVETVLSEDLRVTKKTKFELIAVLQYDKITDSKVIYSHAKGEYLVLNLDNKSYFNAPENYKVWTDADFSLETC